MAYTFSPPANPAFPLEIKRQYQVNSISLGDRYVQRSPEGLNGEVQTVTLRWENLFRFERDYIINFLSARKGTEPFTCTFMEGGRQFVCAEFNDVKVAAGVYSMQATLEQVFDP